MCGVVGWLDRRDRRLDRRTLVMMADALAHRGPDGSGYRLIDAVDGRHRVALGHRRLAIIDPAGGQQPMVDASGEVSLVYNGEIYNFRDLRRELEAAGHAFRTRSDTEVVLAAYLAWGPACVERFRGMFAFAIFDRARNRLVLARDQFGKKPLFLLRLPAGLAFASEIKALLPFPGCGRTLDAASMADYLLYRYVPGPHTLIEGVAKLPPGTYAVWQDGELTETTYYTPPDGSERPAERAGGDPVREFRDALEESVRLRMVSDVPFGAFLSGGLDSSAVVALMSRLGSGSVRTFSVGFRSASGRSATASSRTPPGSRGGSAPSTTSSR